MRPVGVKLPSGYGAQKAMISRRAACFVGVSLVACGRGSSGAPVGAETAPPADEQSGFVVGEPVAGADGVTRYEANFVVR